MTKINITQLAVPELLALRSDIDRQLQARRSELERQLRDIGGGSTARIDGRSLRKGKKVPPKYRDEKGNTWAGRGAQPRWLTAALKSGRKLEDFLVAKPGRKKRS